MGWRRRRQNEAGHPVNLHALYKLVQAIPARAVFIGGVARTVAHDLTLHPFDHSVGMEMEQPVDLTKQLQEQMLLLVLRLMCIAMLNLKM